MIYKTCSRCGKRIPARGHCNCKPRGRSQLGDSGKRTEKITDPFYNTRAWQRKRDAVRARYLGVDVLELYRTGKVIPAEMVHHIIPKRERPDLKLNDGNLVPLSRRSHETVEALYAHNEMEKAKMQKELRAALKYFDEIYGAKAEEKAEG